MTTNDAGVRQSEALTHAAKILSAAKEHENRVRLYQWSYPTQEKAHRALDEAKDRLIAAKAQYAVAYKAYTNPFDVVKTV